MREVGGGGKRAAWRVGYAATADFRDEGSTCHGWLLLDTLRAYDVLYNRMRVRMHF